MKYMDKYERGINYLMNASIQTPEGLKALALIEACYRSSKTNKAVFMRDFNYYCDKID